MTTEPKIYIVDDDATIRDSMRALLESVDLAVETFPTALDFLNSSENIKTGCLLLDVQMPDMNGLELQQRLIEQGTSLQIIIITGHADVPVAVKSLKAGALDFIEKPFKDDVILDCIHRALEIDEKNSKELQSLEEAKARVESLTIREYQVLEKLIQGHPNKVVAFQLGISIRTVEVHRARIFNKTGARNLAHLVRMAMDIGIDPSS